MEEGEWVPLCPAPADDVLIMNAGDLLMWVTNGAVKSAFHRVVPGTAPRLSIVYFHAPRTASVLAPLVDSPLVAASGPLRFPAVTVADLIRARISKAARKGELGAPNM